MASSFSCNDEGRNKNGCMVYEFVRIPLPPTSTLFFIINLFAIEKFYLLFQPTESDKTLSNRQLGQHARQEREQLEQPSRLPRFSPRLTPSHRQQAQIERAKAKRPLIQLDTVLEEFQHCPIANLLGASGNTNLSFDLETRMPPKF